MNTTKFRNLFTLILIFLTMQAFADDAECPVGQMFDTTLNRCIYTKNSKENVDEYKNCESAEDKDACIAAAAKKREQDTRNSYGNDGDKGQVKSVGKSGSSLTTITTAFSVVSAATMAFSDGMSLSDSSLSAKTFAGTSLAGFMKNRSLEDDVDEKAKELKDAYQKQLEDPTSMKDAQISAFDYLQAEQQAVADISKEQKSLYNMMSMGYLATSAIAAYEVYTGTGFANCYKSGDSESANATGGLNGFQGFISKATNPCWLMPIGLVMAGFSRKISAKAEELENEAKGNVESIVKLKEKYEASIAKYCPDGREDLKSPYCYCYLSSGEKNPNRTRSNTCQVLWKDPTNLFVETNDLVRTGDKTKLKGCVMLNGKFDPDCNCKRMKNSSGQNACMKITVPGKSLTSLGSLDTSPAMSSINDILAGNSGGNIDTSVNGQMAIADKARDALQRKINKDLKKNFGINSQKVFDNFMKDANKGAKSSGKRIAIFGDTKNKLSSRRPAMPGVQNAISKVGGKSSKALSLFKGGKNLKGKKVVKTKKKTNWDFDQGSSGASSVANFGSDEEFMKKKYKYDNDITKDKSQSIWKVISRRYTTSGLRRLFDE